MKERGVSTILFFVILFVLYWIIDYYKILFYPPMGIHFIRQTDSLSFAANYLINDYKFFQPQVFNLGSIDGKAAAEFPIIYYIAALLYNITENIELNLRFLNLAIGTIGFWYLFKLLKLLLNDLFFALIFTFLFISSTVLLYYTNNFLPDVSALSFAIVGWYFYFRFIELPQNHSNLYLSFIFFTLSSLLKVVYTINPIAAILSLIMLKFYSERYNERINLIFKKIILIFLISLVTVSCWYLYVHYYNSINQNGYFLIEARPLWDLSKDQIAEVLNYMGDYWYRRYYYPSTWHLFYVLLISGIIAINRSDKRVLFTSIFLMLGAISYLILFFPQFRDHDYYFIALIPAIIFPVVSSFIALRNKFNRLLNSAFIKIIFLIICVLSLNYAREKLIERFTVSNDKFASIGEKLRGVKSFLEYKDISDSSKFIIFSDPTSNGGLYTINRKGWNISDSITTGTEDLEKYIQKGGDYILFTNEKFINFNVVDEFIGEENGIYIYKTKQ